MVRKARNNQAPGTVPIQSTSPLKSYLLRALCPRSPHRRKAIASILTQKITDMNDFRELSRFDTVLRPSIEYHFLIPSFSLPSFASARSD